ncbi:rod shape-determining protein MreB [Parahaliea aestuarii]|uniref:Rod shape-determining protein MreB n=1 Tax=Parahaliea aestuarii TaxID=1852021 RepID=A0A5C8ZX43_9GAMM|nr:rod shape-determining protein MreB [Parahaliea aestuarii]TXS93085.1 rod shape-determining protein MreB [Parahaliea aestuarii]
MIATKSGDTFDDEPLLAISDGKKRRILAIGAPARTAGGTVINPFDHPRLFVHDFQVLEKLLQHSFSAVLRPGFLRPTPVVVWQIDEPLDGGLTTIEMRVLHEASYSAGACEVFIHGGDSLTNEQVVNGVYKQHVI